MKKEMSKMPRNAFRNWGVRQKLFFVTISRPMGPLKRYCACSRFIRKRTSAWNTDQAYVNHEMSGQVSMLLQAIFLMILDADLTTIPQELPYFVDIITSGQAEFVNGSRLVYPVPKGAMTTANMLGNKFFSVAFTYLLGQPVKDTLCGTKALWRSDWARIKPMLGSWGVEDRWGDYELLFGAAKLNLKILDLPVHYQERIYGSTKMTRVFRNGLVMLKMCWHGFLKLKLGY